MIIHEQRITIIKARRPAHAGVNEKLQWLGNSLGLFSLRDKDKSMFRIFIELLKSAKRDMPVTSDQIADRLKLTRGTVMHHINKLLEAGVAVSDKNKYTLRVDNLHMLVDEIERDMERMCQDIKTVAKEIDEYLRMD